MADKSELYFSSLCRPPQEDDLDDGLETDIDPRDQLHQAQEDYLYVGNGLYGDEYWDYGSDNRYVEAEGIFNADGTLHESVDEIYLEGSSDQLGVNAMMRISPNGDYICIGDTFFDEVPQRVTGNLTNGKFELETLCFGNRAVPAVIFDYGIVNSPIYDISTMMVIRKQERSGRNDAPGEFDSKIVVEFNAANQKAIDYRTELIVSLNPFSPHV